MNKKLLTLAVTGTILLFINKWFWQEIADVIKTPKKFPQTEEINKNLNDTLKQKTITKQEYEKQKYKLINKIWDKENKQNDNYKKEFKTLLEKYLSNIEEKEIIQNPELRKRELEMLYFDCKFANITTPKKLKYLLWLTDSRVIN